MWYYKTMRPVILLTALCLVLSGCGGKKARATLPTPNSRPTPVRADLEGLASYYAEPYHGRRTASGEIFDTYKGMTAAHRTLPFNTVVRVTNTTNGKNVDVRINDRGPFVDGRVIDLSVLAARKIDLVGAGVVPVRLKVIKTGSAADGRWTVTVYAVQVAAFENESAAEALRRELQARYGTASIQTVNAGKTLYRVRVGRSTDILDAEKLAARLRADRYDAPFVVKLD